MTKVTKAVNWSAETVEKLTAAYNGSNIEQVAKELGKTVPAVRSKLVSLGVYQKQEPRAVGGASAVRKLQLVKQLAEKLGVELEEVESLEKAKKETLEMLVAFLGTETAE